mmetsp:Transcript_59373/g.168863  ORF Transcript_59373/g.168863 Transcript_59373/m.168863 type:complete len:217 (+) Transcript_59373:203-853(+)
MLPLRQAVARPRPALSLSSPPSATAGTRSWGRHDPWYPRLIHHLWVRQRCLRNGSLRLRQSPRQQPQHSCGASCPRRRRTAPAGSRGRIASHPARARTAAARRRSSAKTQGTGRSDLRRRAAGRPAQGLDPDGRGESLVEEVVLGRREAGRLHRDHVPSRPLLRGRCTRAWCATAAASSRFVGRASGVGHARTQACARGATGTGRSCTNPTTGSTS